MDILHIAGILIIFILAVKGWRRGFINTVGRMLASMLSIGFVYYIHTWALDEFLLTLLTERIIILVRILLCIVLYVGLFLVLYTMIISLRLFSKIPLIRGLNKLLGFLCGGLYGLFLVGFFYWIIF